MLTERAPDDDERRNIDYGLQVARAVAGFDIGQTVVVAAQACVAVEAMEGTDATIERAGRLMHARWMRATPQRSPQFSPAASPSSKSPNPTRTCASTYL